MKTVLKLLCNFAVDPVKTSSQIFLYWSNASDIFIVSRLKKPNITENQALNQFLCVKRC